ncbi:hypothetical protein CEXT_706821 [Caerostris extrusa]|uniref:Uncharacterized protein n=1 Tax=Caerostris extrusa TaxID=172846 RepID=A0AAV4PV00_CAEEX|nr:hypothetical protein CEXT_706821 [Caerostris extrusa]
MPVPFAKSRVPPANSSEHFSTSRTLCPVFQKNSNHRLQNNRLLPIALGQLIPSIYYLFSNFARSFACWALGEYHVDFMARQMDQLLKMK